MDTSWTADKQRLYVGRLDAIDEATFAWFAGWLCADGSIKAHSEKSPKISFTITDRDPLDRFAALFGNKVQGPIPPSGLGKKERYHWQISGWRCVEILTIVEPWLSNRYRERYQRAIAHWKPRERGVKLRPDDVADIRRRLDGGGHGVGAALAREYGVSSGMITAIKKGRVWT